MGERLPRRAGSMMDDPIAPDPRDTDGDPGPWEDEPPCDQIADHAHGSPDEPGDWDCSTHPFTGDPPSWRDRYDTHEEWKGER